MSSWRKRLKRTALILFSVLSLSVGYGADLIKVEQAGDQFVNFVLAEIETVRKKLPAITRAAEAAAERIVGRDGEFLAAGDQGFALEPVWRAGGCPTCGSSRACCR